MTAGYSTVIGNTVKIRLTIYVDDVLTDPGAVVFKIDGPTGVDSTPSVTSVSDGVFTTVFVPTLPGYHRWKATGTAPAAFVREGSFYVQNTTLDS